MAIDQCTFLLRGPVAHGNLCRKTNMITGSHHAGLIWVGQKCSKCKIPGGGKQTPLFAII